MAYSRLFEEKLDEWKPSDYEGFLDSAYMDETLPDDFFDDDIARVMKEDKSYCRLKHRIFERLEDEEGVLEQETDDGPVRYRSSRHGTLLRDENNVPIIAVGSKNVSRPHIDIVPDYEPALAVFNYYMNYMDNPSEEFPSIGVAHPSIPALALERMPFFDTLDDQMSRRGALIYDPSWDFESKNPLSIIVKPESPDIEEEEVKRKMQGKDFFFSTRREIPAKYATGYRVAYLQFNPYHPMALAYMRDKDSVSIDGTVIVGTYTWGSKTVSFRFDPKDWRYRIHSDIWGALVGYTSYYLAMFDIVSNFDILSVLPELLSYTYKFYPFAPTYLAGGFSTAYAGRDTDSSKVTHEQRRMLYSSMTYQTSEYDCSKTALYYTNQVISISPVGENFYDVTAQYKLLMYTGTRSEVLVCDRATNGVQMRIVKGDLTSRFTEKKNIFVLFSVKKKEFRVYSRIGEGDSEVMMYVEGAHFSRCPRNSTGSLIRIPRVFTFLEYVANYLSQVQDSKNVIDSIRLPQIEFPEDQKEYIELEELQVSIQEVLQGARQHKTGIDNIDYEYLESNWIQSAMTHPSIEEEEEQVRELLDNDTKLQIDKQTEVSNRRKKK